MGPRKIDRHAAGVVTLKALAEYVSLTPGTVSNVLNNAPSSISIPKETRDRIHLAARELGYRPNFLARSLRKKRTYTMGVIAHEIGDGFGSSVVAALKTAPVRKNTFSLLGSHRHDAELFEKYLKLLLQRRGRGHNRHRF
jgi:LacI family transcriptional regulator